MSRIKWNYELVKAFIEDMGFNLISKEYIKTKSQLNIKCSKGHEFSVSFASFKKNSKCPICEGYKFNYEYVKEYIESQGYKMLSKKYVNNNTKILIECNKGHKFEMQFNNFKYGQRCPKCAGVEKLTYEEVKGYIESFGYKLISDTYVNNSSKLKILCEEGHIFYMGYNDFKQGKRCPKCVGKSWSYDEVKEYIESFNYELLSKEYITAKEKLVLKCPNGHIFKMSLTKFKCGQRCVECHNIKMSNKMRHDYNYIKDYIESFGYKLLSNEYINNKNKLILKCPKNHVFQMTFDNFKRGCRCTTCYDMTRGNSKRLTYDYVEEYVSSKGYKLLSKKYKNNSSKLLFKCPNGHIFSMNFAKFKQGRRCPKCINKSSGENRIKEFLLNKSIDFKREHRFDDCKCKNTLPFDFYLVDYNTLIEFDGIQHFEIIDYFGGFDAFVKLKIRDTIKNIYCEKNNIKLIRIPYWEFDNIEEILNRELIK